ncbi:hypothetical protein PF0699 [Pyrococcus furiosus DSM 3638]|uniref:Uncharacterized protein n=1 Tax=Pyrococcus furiosus (strain ATCC 43587 / DSM 3638 / JCM 8422 / Vc1) TaxID=186497 RepID=Q8U2X9_PYRFU|nr:hypothetical protein PF0699 [Pyrococcus furiosus DSM 3638]
MSSLFKSSWNRFILLFFSQISWNQVVFSSPNLLNNLSIKNTPTPPMKTAKPAESRTSLVPTRAIKPPIGLPIDTPTMLNTCYRPTEVPLTSLGTSVTSRVLASIRPESAIPKAPNVPSCTPGVLTTIPSKKAEKDIIDE